MILKDIVEKIGLKARTASEKLGMEVSGGYASDLLSDVLANAQPGNLWVTSQVHQNVIGVAVVRELSGVIIVNGKEPDEETLKRAQGVQRKAARILGVKPSTLSEKLKRLGLRD